MKWLIQLQGQAVRQDSKSPLSSNCRYFLVIYQKIAITLLNTVITAPLN